MKKLNKKGFTLIEMLVVIAIIAILVAIIIPTVTNATTKAGAAANAANLRAVYAEIQMDLLAGGANTDGYVSVAADGAVTINATAPKAAKCLDTTKGTAMVYDATNKTVNYGTGKTIEYFATVAETGSAPTT